MQASRWLFAAAAPPLAANWRKKIDSKVSEGDKFAVVYIGNHQYKISPGDVIAVQRMYADIGSRISIRKVMMVGGPNFTAIGRPFLNHVRIVADVEEQKNMKNVISFYAPWLRRLHRWVDTAHAATILRIREIEYNPVIVGELSKYEGKLEKDPSANNQELNRTYWCEKGTADQSEKSEFLKNRTVSYPSLQN